MHIYAIDFDGTLCEDKFPDIGKPYKDMIDYTKQLKEQGNKIILWTSRSGEDLKAASEWCKGHGLVFDAYNDNLPENITAYNNNSRKIFADYYIDDRNLFVARKKPEIAV